MKIFRSKEEKEIDAEVKKFKAELIKKKAKEKALVLEDTTYSYLRELIDNVSRKNVEILITKPNGETHLIRPLTINKKTAETYEIGLPEEIY